MVNPVEVVLVNELEAELILLVQFANEGVVQVHDLPTVLKLRINRAREDHLLVEIDPIYELSKATDLPLKGSLRN